MRIYNKRSYHLALWPTVLVTLGLRSLVPGELLIRHGIWLLPGMAVLHIGLHMFFAWRRAQKRKRYGLTKFFSHWAFLLFFMFQIEVSRGASHPVIIWLLHEIIGFQLEPNTLLYFTDPVFNGLNFFLAGLLLFSYYNMMIETWQVPYAKRLLDVLEEQETMASTELVHRPTDLPAAAAHGDEDEEQDTTTAAEEQWAEQELHHSRLRIHLPSESRLN